MKYEDRELLDRLAAEFVVGTMQQRSRKRFERLCATNPHARAAVKKWEDRMVGLIAKVKPEQPSPQVWTGIEKRLGFAADAKESSFFAWLGSRWSAAAFATVAALAIGIGVYLNQSIQAQQIAAFTAPERGEIWRVKSTKQGDKLVVEATNSVVRDDAHDYELWALPEGGAPVSLGVLPKSGFATLALNALQRAALGGASKVAVSLEPLGGSPTGTPGTVLHVADVTKVG
jgi:anti-sigma-K factor RskA